MKYPTEVDASRSLTVKTHSHKEFDTLEETVREGLRKTLDVGNALRKIRDKKYYKLIGFRNFNDYCEARWDITRKQGDRLIRAAEASKWLTPLGVEPAGEGVLRPILYLKPDEQRAIWKQVISEANETKPITSSLVSRVKRQVCPVSHRKHKGRVPEKVNRKALCKHLETWFAANPKLHQLAGEALLCKIVAQIRRYGT